VHEGLIHLAASDTVALTLGALEHDMRAIGVIAGAYFLTPAFHSQVGKRTIVKHFGFAEAVMASYLDPANFEHDPTPDYVMRTGRTMSWKQAIDRDDMTAVQRATVDRLREIGLVDGVSVPLYGPNGRDSYSAFLFDRALGPEDETLVKRMAYTARQHHHRICLLIERDYKTPVAISKRESEVLYWMARGKSNADIAAILGISPGTIDTFVRRIYAKFDVHDRISAILEGMSRGLLKLG
jgi:DNA-binding CsgD family transcriptional regulator